MKEPPRSFSVGANSFPTPTEATKVSPVVFQLVDTATQSAVSKGSGVAPVFPAPSPDPRNDAKTLVSTLKDLRSPVKITQFPPSIQAMMKPPASVPPKAEPMKKPQAAAPKVTPVTAAAAGSGFVSFLLIAAAAFWLIRRIL